MTGKIYKTVGVAEIWMASIDHSKSTSASAKIGATLRAADAALVAALVPVMLRDMGDIELERKSTRSDGLETENKTPDREIIAIEYRVIRRNMFGFGQHPIYQDKILGTQCSLNSTATMQMRTGPEDVEDLMREIGITDEVLSLANIESAFDKELVWEIDTYFL